MTWNYEISDDGTQMKIWETGTSTTKSPDHTKALDPSNRKPDIEEVLEIMKEKVKKNGPEAANSGNATSDQGVSPYGWKVMADMNAKDIKEKK